MNHKAIRMPCNCISLHLQPTRYHRCQTLVFKNGLRVQKRPEAGVGGERLLQDLLIAGHDLDKDREGETDPKK